MSDGSQGGSSPPMRTHFSSILSASVFVVTLGGCTSGKLEYTDHSGNIVQGCHVEYSWAPSVDKHAVQYILAHCARQAIKKGHKVEDENLLTLDLSIPPPPCGKVWDHELAKQYYRREQLTAREYGYIIAHIDLGLATATEC